MKSMKSANKKSSYVQLAKAAKLQSDCKKKKCVNYEEGQGRPMCDVKKCQSTKFYKNPVCDDKNGQSTKCVNMWPVKPTMDMQSVEQAIQSSHKKALCSDKNCQSTTCYKKKYPRRSVCEDKNCQSTLCSDKNNLLMQSGTRTASNQTGTQPEITRNC